MKNTTLIIPEQKTHHFYLPSHTITYSQDLSLLEKRLSKKDLETYLLLYEFACKAPRRAQKEVETFYFLHFNCPEVSNLLTFIYMATGKIRRGDSLIEENFRKNPDYLFARINYADLALRRKQGEKIPGLFRGSSSLQEFLPHRSLFHISEFRGFMVLMGLYHLSQGQSDVAKCYHYVIHSVDPSHPGTRLLGKKLYHLPFYKKSLLWVSEWKKWFI